MDCSGIFDRLKFDPEKPLGRLMQGGGHYFSFLLTEERIAVIRGLSKGTKVSLQSDTEVMLELLDKGVVPFQQRIGSPTPEALREALNAGVQVLLGLYEVS